MGLLEDLRTASAENAAGGGGGGNEYAESWRWEVEGDGIEGTVITTSSRVSENHPDGYPIVTIRLADGTDRAVHGLTYVLKDEITKRGIKPGDTFAVLYRGKKTSGQGRSFHDFAVGSKRGDGTVPQAANPVPTTGGDPWSTPDQGTDAPPF